MASTKTGNKTLNAQQMLFCKYYATEEFFCNGTKSYMKAYDTDQESARRLASKLLTNIDILNYIDSLLVDMGMNDQRVDRELTKMMLQDEDKAAKMKAMDMYYKITARIEKGLQKAIDK
jgi:phage terminase small subunit